MNRKEQEPAWYENQYMKALAGEGSYCKAPEETQYIKIWEKAISLLSQQERIFDLGCGVGQFAELSRKRGKNYVRGIDFSSNAIRYCKIRNLDIRNRFFIGDLKNPQVFNFKDYDTAILLEVLEHIENDLDVIKNIESKKRIVFSLPNYDYKSHVRYFNSDSEIRERYGELLIIKSVNEFSVNPQASKIIWLIDSERN